MPAVGQVHAQHRVSGLNQSEIHREVGLGAGMGLDVGVFRAEQLFGPLDGEGFHLVHALAAAVIALAGITFGVFIGENRTHGGHNSRGDQVFGSDQLDIPSLAGQLLLHGCAQFRVVLGDKVNGRQQICVHGFHPFFVSDRACAADLEW